MLRNHIKIEEKKLEFVFEIVNVQFNKLGQYRFLLTVENPLLAGSGCGVQLRVKDEEIIQANPVSTDTVEQACLVEVYAFSSNKFVFTLPKGGICYFSFGTLLQDSQHLHEMKSVLPRWLGGTMTLIRINCSLKINEDQKP